MKDINKKSDHSLGPDKYTGWKHNQTHHPFKQFPLHFTNPQVDLLSKSLTSFGTVQPFRVVYMGPRHLSNLKAFKMYSMGSDQQNIKDEIQMYGQSFQKYEFRYRGQKQKPYGIRAYQYRLFTGMNPTIKRMEIQFDSKFQCGNLDLAVMVNPAEYDLLMRVDSNTKGHTTWFYFKVTQFQHKQKVKFNLINFQKSGLLYSEGMKPYCFRSSKKIWQQQGTEVEFKTRRFRYQQNGSDPVVKKCLSWNYEFSKEDNYVYFAYCVPYSYSYMMHVVDKLQKETPHLVSVNYQHYSTGGLVIPVLTITNPSNLQGKPGCMAISRLHPGQTQGSWMMDGFLRFICSKQGYYLRQKLVFKVIPMVCVDGVVLGNFRTSIVGRDINRYFHRPDIYDQVALVRSVAEKNKPLLYLDFHGHSARKNAFMYGPNYGVEHKHFLACRLLPKLISKLTNSFRYYSCIFKISNCKVNTSRGVMLREGNVPFAFTIQASSFAYGPKLEEQLFKRESYSLLGAKIGQGLASFIQILFKLPKRLEQKEEKEKNKQGKSPLKDEKQSKKNDFTSNLFSFDKTMLEALGDQKDIFDELLKDEKTMDQERQKQQTGSKGNISEDSDFEEGCDYTDKQLVNMIKSQNSQDSLKIVASITKKKKKKKVLQQKEEDSMTKQQFLNSPIKKSKTKVLQRQKSFGSLDKLSPIRQKFQRKLKVISVQAIQGPPMPQSKSSILNTSQIFAQSGKMGDNLNKVHYKNWRKFQEPQQSIVHPFFNFDKPNPINHVTLSYCEPEQRTLEEQTFKDERKEHQKKGSKPVRKLTKQGRQKDLFSHKQIKAEEVFQVREPMLPLLKKSFNERKSNLSFLQQLLQKSAGSEIRNLGRKNMKILHF